MADVFKLSLNELEFAVEVPDGILADIINVFSEFNYSSWKASNEITFTTDGILDVDALNAFATKERFFAVHLRDYVLDKYSNVKCNQAIATANIAVRNTINDIKNQIVTTQ